MQLKRSALPIFLLTAATLAPAKDKHRKKQDDIPQDAIEVVAHVPLAGDRVTHFIETQHYRRDYLYAEHANGKSVTLIDVTHPEKPALLSEADFPARSSDSLVAVTGNAALVAVNTNSQPNAIEPRTYRIMSFADPAHPAVKQELDGVTAVASDDKRELIFLANGDGLWILHRRYAMDPEYVKEWEHMMLDNR